MKHVVIASALLVSFSSFAETVAIKLNPGRYIVNLSAPSKCVGLSYSLRTVAIEDTSPLSTIHAELDLISDNRVKVPRCTLTPNTAKGLVEVDTTSKLVIGIEPADEGKFENLALKVEKIFSNSL